MDNLATQLNDIAVTRAILLQHVGTSISKDISKAYLSILDDIKSKILKHETIDSARSKAIIKEIKAIVYPDLGLSDKMQDLAMQERDFIISSTNLAVGAPLFAAVPPESVILAIGKSPIIEGALLSSWINGLNDKLSFEMQRSINLSMLQGESMQQAAKRLTSVMGIGLNQAETLARTAIADVSNRVREEVYEANSSVIKGRRHVSVLDGRTSLICISRDGAEWSNDGKGLNASGKANTFRKPPLHMRCRSYLEPILKSWKELGEDIQDIIPKTTRATMDGQRPSDMTFADWLKGKDPKFVEDLLGKGRSELYLNGKISVGDLVTKGGNTVSLSQLKQK